jgi:hypothetical protein
MFGRKKKTEAASDDVEMAAPRRRGTQPHETEYQPINWKRVFLAPKYIRTSEPPAGPIRDAVFWARKR